MAYFSYLINYRANIFNCFLKLFLVLAGVSIRVVHKSSCGSVIDIIDELNVASVACVVVLEVAVELNKLIFFPIVFIGVVKVGYNFWIPISAATLCENSSLPSPFPYGKYHILNILLVDRQASQHLFKSKSEFFCSSTYLPIA